MFECYSSVSGSEKSEKSSFWLKSPSKIPMATTRRSSSARSASPGRAPRSKKGRAALSKDRASKSPSPISVKARKPTSVKKSKGGGRSKSPSRARSRTREEKVGEASKRIAPDIVKKNGVVGVGEDGDMEVRFGCFRGKGMVGACGRWGLLILLFLTRSWMLDVDGDVDVGSLSSLLGFSSLSFAGEARA